MKTIDGQPIYTLDAPDEPWTTEPTVRVAPSVCEPRVVLMLHKPRGNWVEQRTLEPAEAREVAKALIEAAEIVEAGSYQPWKASHP